MKCLVELIAVRLQFFVFSAAGFWMFRPITALILRAVIRSTYLIIAMLRIILLEGGLIDFVEGEMLSFIRHVYPNFIDFFHDFYSNFTVL